MIKVVNRKTFKGKGTYIGRPTPLGNPFEIGKHGDRDQVVRKYKRWIWDKFHSDETIFWELIRFMEFSRVNDLNLICWCAPLPCHGDIIKDFLEYLHGERTWWISADYATFGLVSKGGIVTEAAPISKKSIGRPLGAVLSYYKTHKEAQTCLVS